jgi:hypothetical protein
MKRKIGKQLGVRLSDSERKALESVVSEAELKTYGFAPVSEVVKELMGLKPYKLVSESQRKRLLKD